MAWFISHKHRTSLRPQSKVPCSYSLSQLLDRVPLHGLSPGQGQG